MIHGHTIALSSNLKYNGVTVYNLSVGIYKNGFKFAHIPSNKW